MTTLDQHVTTTTVGQLSADAIGRDRILIQHEGSTISGVLRGLDIEADTLTAATHADPHRVFTGDVSVRLTIGSITVGPLERDHGCEVIA